MEKIKCCMYKIKSETGEMIHEGKVSGMKVKIKELCVKISLMAILLYGFLVFMKPDRASAASQKDAIVNYALSQVGTKERSAGSDNILYNDWYYNKTVTNSWSGQYAWCHVFVSYCANACGISTDIIPKKASCQEGVNWFRQKGRYHMRSSGYAPAPGDIIYLSTDGTNTAHHVGIVYAVDNSTVYYVDGNNTTTNPHGVAKSKRARNSSSVLGYGNPAYLGAASESAPVQQIPSIHSVKINTINSRDSINFSFSVSNGTLAKVMVESVLTGKNTVKTYSSGLSKITETFNRSTFPTGGNQYRIYLYAYSGSQSSGYHNEQTHKITFGNAVQYVTFPDTISNEQMKAITFQYKFYADMYPDLKRKFGYNEGLLYKHWLEYGIKEGRIAAPGYSSSYYLKDNGDVAKAFGAANYEMAFYHWTTYGCQGEGRDSSPVFSIRHYMNANSDIAKVYGRTNWLQAAIHFNQIGLYEFRNSSEYYNGAWYKDNNADLKKLNMSSYDLLLHYYQFGIKERRVANSGRKIPNA